MKRYKPNGKSATIPVPSSPGLLLDLKATAADTGMAQVDVIRQALKLGIPALRSRLGQRPRRRLPLDEHFARLKGLALPPYLDEHK